MTSLNTSICINFVFKLLPLDRSKGLALFVSLKSEWSGRHVMTYTTMEFDRPGERSPEKNIVDSD